MTLTEWQQIRLVLGLALIAVRPLGLYMAAVFEGRFTLPLLRSLERGFYRRAGVAPEKQQGWLNAALFSAVAFATLGTAALGVASARAENVTKECAAKYQVDKAANQLGGQTYFQYYSKCSAEIKARNAVPATPAAEVPVAPAAAPVEAPAPAPAPVAAPVAAPAPIAPAIPAAQPPAKPAKAPKPAVAPADSGSVVFPKAVAPAYANRKAGDARKKTCADQYKANKAAGGNGGLKWSERGGGYYSECDKKLKGE